MSKYAFNRFFPTPNFLSAPSFGLDISDISLKYAELIVGDQGLQIGRYGELPIPSGVIESGKIKNTAMLKKMLLTLKSELNLKSVRISLPEEQVYLFKLDLEKRGMKHFRASIELQLEEHIPIPAKDTIFDFEVLSQNDNSLELQVAAIPTGVIENYLSLFEDSGIVVQSCELEAQAIARAVIAKGDKETYMIVDFGKTRTGIFIISRGVVAFTSTFDVGGVSIEKQIAENLHVSFEEAEKLKISNGMKKNEENKEIYSIILKIVSELGEELKKQLLYWNTHIDEDGNARPTIKKIILCGGDSNIVGFSEYVSTNIKVPVELADVWINIRDTSQHVSPITFSKSLAFASVIGLALGDFDHD